MHPTKEFTLPRWKGKGFADIAHSNPLSKLVEQLQSTLNKSGAQALLSGSDALLEAEPELADLLNRTCFGRSIVTCEKNKHWFQLGPEEAFYLCHELRCLRVSKGEERPLSETELLEYMRSKKRAFPAFYKAYAHLRAKHWVVRPGSQYGVDLVAYRHHPALVHAEYAVIVDAEGEDDGGARLRVWSDLQCALRVSGSVAKTLLVLSISSCGGDASSPECLAKYLVEERIVARWVAEQCREDHGLETS